ncbi:uncharacterized protein LOC135497680 [Lineus longissimus]|uniref:uncharacterized protein LOC135497680 n=1 Tax=Lineus longissimus TaxID=88925 RepID=UPI00315C8526
MMPSPDKIFAPVNFFLDDMSANKSRRWKPLHVIQAQSAIVPVNLRSKLDFVRFISASERVPILDLMKVIKEHIDTIKESGIEVFDAATKSAKLVMTETCCGIADFTELQAVCCHLGPNTHKFCPRCHATAKDFGQKSVMRSVEETRTTLSRMSIRTNNQELRKQTGIKEGPGNLVMDMLNPHEYAEFQICFNTLYIIQLLMSSKVEILSCWDIPVTILPWIYLGLGKHLLKFCINKLDDKKKEKLVLHLRSIDQSDVSVAFTSDITKYLDSRQGKDIKQYLQLALFNFDYAGLEPRFLKMLCKLATISKTIDETKIYTTDSIINLQEELNGYLKQVRENAPHLGKKIDDIRNHGPPKAYRKDQFEKLHCNIRKILFNQNQLARSRDTVRQIADCQILQHILDGGYFKNGGEWVSCGSNVRAIGESSMVKKFLGYPQEQQMNNVPMLRKLKKVNNGAIGEENVLEASACRAMSGEIANVGNAVLYENEHGMECFGIFMGGKKICLHQEITIQKLMPMRQKRLGCELVAKSAADSICTRPSKLIRKISVLHECQGGHCVVMEKKVSRKVEQKSANVLQKLLKHNEDHNVWIVNKFRLNRFNAC